MIISIRFSRLKDWKPKSMTGYNEEDFLLLSGIQHYNFCRRQWALIHIEQQWEENVRTLEGTYVHRVADQPLIREKRGDKLVVRALPVQSRELGITGICDVVEFIRDPKESRLQERKDYTFLILWSTSAESRRGTIQTVPS